jgi:hypothetical protein
MNPVEAILTGVVKCQGILEGCLPLSTLPVTPAYSPVAGSGQVRLGMLRWKSSGGRGHQGSCRGCDRLNQLRKLNRLGIHEPVKSIKNLLERLATS